MSFALLKNKNFQVLISVVWGLGLAMFFKKTCKERGCIIIKGPKPDEMHNKIFSFNDKCYKYTAQSTSCSAKNGPTQIIDATN
jgi:hypothetical protein